VNLLRGHVSLNYKGPDCSEFKKTQHGQLNSMQIILSRDRSSVWIISCVIGSSGNGARAEAMVPNFCEYVFRRTLDYSDSITTMGSLRVHS
jgi:hypothetical protein